MNYKNIGLIIIIMIFGYFTVINPPKIVLSEAIQTSQIQEVQLNPSKSGKVKGTVSIENDKILNTEDDRPVVLLFTANWCSGCRQFKPFFARAKEDIGNGYRYVEVNVDKNYKLVNYFKVYSIPSLYIYDKKNNYKAKVDMRHFDSELKNYLIRRSN